MTDQYLANVFPLLRQLCSIVRIDCSHRTAKHCREKVVQKYIDPTTNETTTQVSKLQTFLCYLYSCSFSVNYKKSKSLVQIQILRIHMCCIQNACLMDIPTKNTCVPNDNHHFVYDIMFGTYIYLFVAYMHISKQRSNNV